MTTVHPTHKVQAIKTVKDEEVELFEIRLKTTPATFLYLTAGPSVTWQGKNYQTAEIQISGGDQTRTEGGFPRGTLRVGLLNGSISNYIEEGYLDLAVVTRHTVLGAHITGNINISSKRVWIIGRITADSPGVGIECELRVPQDNPKHLSPSEFFIPPKFNFVVF